MSDKPNFYSILTATVRYDNRLTDSEKILYSEITSLTLSTGECWASNSYFSELYKVTPQAISKRINKLMKYGYLSIEYEREKGQKNINKRIIKLTDIGVSTTVDRYQLEIKGGINQGLRGYQPEVKENNTSINITSNNNIPFSEIINYLNQQANRNYRAIESNKKYIRSRWNEGYSLEDFKKVIDNKVAEWSNTEFNDYLRPSTLFGTKFDNYLNQAPKKAGNYVAPVPEYQKEVEMPEAEEKALREKIKAMLEGNHES